MRQKQRVGLAIGIALLAGAVAPGGAAYAADASSPSEHSPAAPTSPPPSNLLKLFVRIADEPVVIDQALIDSHTAGLETLTEHTPEQVMPYLIDFDQWFRCFTLNEEDDVFALYTENWDGTPHDIRLKCGAEKWGYKHIRADKEIPWQDKLDAARATGWESETQGIESWDDLMAASVGESILYPDYRGSMPLDNKACAVVELGVVNVRTNEIMYAFRAAAVWGTNNDRLISAYPTSKQVC